jgi:MFS transporter, DHA1 family, multidrug resistance protein
MSSETREQPRVSIRMAALLGMLTALAPFTIDTYLPAFPRIAADFGAHESAAEQTLAATMIGFAVGQLLIGPWSDRVGRRRPMLVGLTVHAVASLLAFAAPTFWFFLAARVAEGAGAAAGTVLALAIARDKYSGRPLVTAFGRIALVSGVAPLVAPVIGSQSVQLADWRWIFALLALYSTVLLVLTAVYLPETRPATLRQAVRGVHPARTYLHLLRHRPFDGILLVAGMRFTVLFAYLQVSPFILQSDHGLSVDDYAIVLAANSIGMLVGVQASTRLARWISPARVLSSSMGVLLVAGVVVLATGQIGAPTGFVIAGFSALMLACGLGLPMIQSLGLEEHPADAGAAAALINAAAFGSSAVLSPLTTLPGSFGVNRTVSLGLVILIATAVAAVAFATTRKVRSRQKAPVPAGRP